jgi:hypothetical protein
MGFTRVPWGFNQYRDFNCELLQDTDLEARCICSFSFNSQEWRKYCHAPKLALSKGSHQQTINKITSRVKYDYPDIPRRLWYVPIKWKQGTLAWSMRIYVFRYKSQITDLVKEYKVREIMEA